MYIPVVTGDHSFKHSLSRFKYIEDICCFFFFFWGGGGMKDRNLFHRVNTIGNIFRTGTRDEINFDLSPKNTKYSVYFMLLTLSGRRFIKIQYSCFPLFPVAYPFRIATQLQYYVKREKCKVNDVIFPSGC